MPALSEHFTYRKLLQYLGPSMIMMIFTSIYGVVDGLFVSNFAGKTAFAAVNFVFPLLMLLGGMGFMFGSGGSALVAKTLGEGQRHRANEIFSCLLWTSVAVGVLLLLLGELLLRPVVEALGAEGALLADSVVYGRIYLLGVPFTVVQYEFQNLYSTAGKPKLGLWSTVASGLTNVLLDALFVAALGWGLRGAAAATVLAQCTAGLLPFFYFGRDNRSELRLVRSRFEARAMARICTNGVSELLNNLSMTLIGVLYNAQLLQYAGNDGLAAYGVLMYVDFLFISLFIGYTVGISPIISYHYGAQNPREIRSLLQKSTVLLGGAQLLLFALSELSAGTVSRLFVGYYPELLAMTRRGFLLYSFTFLFSGYAMLPSAVFTALNNGLISAILSFMRMLVYEVAAILVLPIFWGLDGIWVAVAAAELLAAVQGAIFIAAYRKKYGY